MLLHLKHLKLGDLKRFTEFLSHTDQLVEITSITGIPTLCGTCEGVRALGILGSVKPLWANVQSFLAAVPQTAFNFSHVSNIILTIKL